MHCKVSTVCQDISFPASFFPFCRRSRRLKQRYFPPFPTSSMAAVWDEKESGFLPKKWLTIVIHVSVVSKIDNCNALYIWLPLKSVQKLHQVSKLRQPEVPADMNTYSRSWHAFIGSYWFPRPIESAGLIRYKAFTGLEPWQLVEHLFHKIATHPTHSMQSLILEPVASKRASTRN